MIQQEEWRSVVDYEGVYEISSEGRVRRISWAFRKRESRPLATHIDSAGYPMVTLYRGQDCVRRRIHRLMAQAFLGTRPRGYEVNHIDSDRANNNLGNLEWVTHTGNMAHAAKVGRLPGQYLRGETNPSVRLTPEQVLEIRRLRGQVGQDILAAKYGVSPYTIRDIHQGRTWRHLSGGSAMTLVTLAEILPLRVSGLNISQIAKRLDIPWDMVKRRLKYCETA